MIIRWSVPTLTRTPLCMPLVPRSPSSPQHMRLILSSRHVSYSILRRPRTLDTSHQSLLPKKLQYALAMVSCLAGFVSSFLSLAPPATLCRPLNSSPRSTCWRLFQRPAEDGRRAFVHLVCWRFAVLGLHKKVMLVNECACG